MLWTLLVVLVGTCCRGSDSQPTLTQAPSASVSPGDTVKFSCAISSGFSFVNHVVWYQQKPGNPPLCLLSCWTDSNKNQGSGVPSRFSGSKDALDTTGYLTIAGALAEDEAHYYCSTWHTNSWIFGGGTQVIVTGQQPSPPNVHLFPPSPEEKESKNKATLVCLVDGFHPPAITVTWEADGTAVSSGVETTKPTKLNDKYMASSYLTLSPSDWESHEKYSCKVMHEGSPYVKSVSHSQCP